MLGAYTNLEEMKANHNFIKVISHYLNPNINEFMKYIQDELDYSFKVDMPAFEDDGKFQFCMMNPFTLFRTEANQIGSRCIFTLSFAVSSVE